MPSMNNSINVRRGLRENPRRGGRQQPHHSLKKFKKYKGGKKQKRLERTLLTKLLA